MDTTAPARTCPYDLCSMAVVHSHGTDVKYQPRVSQPVCGKPDDEPLSIKRGSLDALLLQAYRAGANDQVRDERVRARRRGQIAPEPESLDVLLTKFRTWRRGMTS